MQLKVTENGVERANSIAHAGADEKIAYSAAVGKYGEIRTNGLEKLQQMESEIYRNFLAGQA